MGTPIQITLGGSTGIPEKFWEHIRAAEATDINIVSLYDDSQEQYAGVGSLGIHHQLRSYTESECVSDADVDAAQKWVEGFYEKFGDELDMYYE